MTPFAEELEKLGFSNTSKMSVGGGPSIKFVSEKNGDKFIIKAPSGRISSRPHIEYAAYLLSDRMGMTCVPLVQMVDILGAKCSVQKWVEEKNKPRFSAEIAALDIIAGGVDRRISHNVIHENAPMAIDNESLFMSDGAVFKIFVSRKMGANAPAQFGSSFYADLTMFSQKAAALTEELVKRFHPSMLDDLGLSRKEASSVLRRVKSTDDIASSWRRWRSACCRHFAARVEKTWSKIEPELMGKENEG